MIHHTWTDITDLKQRGHFKKKVSTVIIKSLENLDSWDLKGCLLRHLIIWKEIKANAFIRDRHIFRPGVAIEHSVLESH